MLGDVRLLHRKIIEGKMLTHMCVGTTYAKGIDTRAWLLVRRERGWNCGYPQSSRWNCGACESLEGQVYAKDLLTLWVKTVELDIWGDDAVLEG